MLCYFIVFCCMSWCSYYHHNFTYTTIFSYYNFLFYLSLKVCVYVSIRVYRVWQNVINNTFMKPLKWCFCLGFTVKLYDPFEGAICVVLDFTLHPGVLFILYTPCSYKYLYLHISQYLYLYVQTPLWSDNRSHFPKCSALRSKSV